MHFVKCTWKSDSLDFDPFFIWQVKKNLIIVHIIFFHSEKYEKPRNNSATLKKDLDQLRNGLLELSIFHSSNSSHVFNVWSKNKFSYVLKTSVVITNTNSITYNTLQMFIRGIQGFPRVFLQYLQGKPYDNFIGFPRNL